MTYKPIDNKIALHNTKIVLVKELKIIDHCPLFKKINNVSIESINTKGVNTIIPTIFNVLVNDPFPPKASDSVCIIPAATIHINIPKGM